MTATLDPYHRWLGIPAEEQPANHYRLLGLAAFEDDPEVVRDAAQRQMAHVRAYALGTHAELSQKILNELGKAKACLLDPERKEPYDVRLRGELEALKRAASAPALSGYRPPPGPPPGPPPLREKAGASSGPVAGGVEAANFAVRERLYSTSSSSARVWLLAAGIVLAVLTGVILIGVFILANRPGDSGDGDASAAAVAMGQQDDAGAEPAAVESEEEAAEAEGEVAGKVDPAAQTAGPVAEEESLAGGVSTLPVADDGASTPPVVADSALPADGPLIETPAAGEVEMTRPQPPAGTPSGYVPGGPVDSSGTASPVRVASASYTIAFPSGKTLNTEVLKFDKARIQAAIGALEQQFKLGQRGAPRGVEILRHPDNSPFALVSCTGRGQGRPQEGVTMSFHVPTAVSPSALGLMGVTVESHRMVPRTHVSYIKDRKKGWLRTWNEEGQRAFWCEYVYDRRSGFGCFFENEQLCMVGEYGGGRLECVHLIEGDKILNTFEPPEKIEADQGARGLWERFQASEKSAAQQVYGVKRARNARDEQIRQRLASQLGVQKRNNILNREKQRDDEERKDQQQLQRMHWGRP